MPKLTLIERARGLADPDTRKWAKAAEVADDLEGPGYGEAAQDLINAIDNLRSALDSKESAMEEGGAERADSLATAWDEATGALEEIANAADILEGLFAK